MIEAGRHILAGDLGALICDEDEYRKRFSYFDSYFYKEIYNRPYPQDYAQQAILYLCPEDEMLFLALNSCWEIDYKHPHRAGIHPNAIASAIHKIMQENYNDWLKIAVWHHPVHGPESMRDVAFLEQLAVNGFQIGIHGHIHEAKDEYFRYDANRGLRIIAAGTFGAPVREQVTGIPLQYNLLTIDSNARILTVETRKKEKVDGAWSADARWGDKNNPEPRYDIPLQYNAKDEANQISEDSPVTLEKASPSPFPIAPALPYSLRSHLPKFSDLTTLDHFIQILERRFDFRWEPRSFATVDGPPIVYWPVRLRHPTPIHAVQAFAAAGLQKLGATIELSLDNLGSVNTTVEVFAKRVKQWFSGVGAAPGALTVRQFNEILNEDKGRRIWESVERWLGRSEYRLNRIFEIAKYWEPDSPPKTLDDIIFRKPRRLLTPALVWTCLLYVHSQASEKRIITLGGYDEQLLWNAWHDHMDAHVPSLGHLYIPKLDTFAKTLHMEETPLAWTSLMNLSHY